MFLYVFEYIFLCSCTQLKKLKTGYLLTVVISFRTAPVFPSYTEIQPLSPALLLLAHPVPALDLEGEVTKPPWVPAHVLPCLLWVQMDLLLHGQRKEELQNVTAGNVCPTHNMPQPKLQTLTRLISHPCQLNMYIKLLPCMRRGLGS